MYDGASLPVEQVLLVSRKNSSLSRDNFYKKFTTTIQLTRLGVSSLSS